ncbi:MAG: class I SAM-dependent DNA methyltransferase [Planctomycetota bacterium]|jgi:type I restriction enzyme M protein|nr:class I SAM-dependent DNA methyltransferase [Planctomycetota bacterium]
MADTAVHSQLVSFIWDICNLLRGPYKRNEYRKVILPLTVLRRFDCVLAPTKSAVLAQDAKLQDASEAVRFAKLREVAGTSFVNTSKLDFPKLLDDSTHIASHLHGYINAFSPNVREIMEKFKIAEQIDFMESKNLLYQVVKAFAEVDLSPARVSNLQMGYVFEELIRIGAEQANEEAGAHFTPREVIKLMVNLLFCDERSELAVPGKVVTLYDPACGTGGMLSVAEEHLHQLNSAATVISHGQDYNNESFAICKADMLIKGNDADKIALGNTFTDDQHPDGRFAYMLSNPPFGVEWKQEQKHITDEHDKLGYKGRFGPGLPRINDGALLFLLHMCSKMRPPAEGGSRIAIVFNGSPLFTGDAESGESEIRRWLIENDYLEGIVSLPDQMFYNTGISTYIWIVSNHKPAERKGTVALINGSKLFIKMKKSLGNKRNKLGEGSESDSGTEPDHIGDLTRVYGGGTESDIVKIFKGTDFAYRKITVERPRRLRFAIDQAGIDRLQAEGPFQNLAKSKKKGPAGLAEAEAGQKLQAALVAGLTAAITDQTWPKRDAFLKHLKPILKQVAENAGSKLPSTMLKTLWAALSERDDTADICTDKKGNPEPDTSLRDTENVPWDEDIDAYMAREVLPHVPDAWVDESKTKVGYEIPFTRHFYEYQPLRPLADIEAEIKDLEAEIQGMLGEAVG